MKVGILCAGDRELAPFLSMLTDAQTSSKMMLTIYEGCLANVQVAMLYSGVCKVNAAVAAQLLLSDYGCDVIVNAGTAGAMDSSLALFDTVVSTEVAYHDVAEHILTEFHPWMSSGWFYSDRYLLEAARQAAKGYQNVHFGRMVTGEAFITDESRDDINARLQPLSVDMESAAVAHVCYANGVPFIAVRTMTDTPSHTGIAAFEDNCARASAISAKFVYDMLGNLREVYS